MKPTDVRAIAPAIRLPVEEIRTRVEVREEGEEEEEEEEEDDWGGRAGVAKYGIWERRVRREERV